mmetsp:Transcript_13311/g.36696  ORF Transcript_13311/g.36696 Transcript_13311/m.36696 type:complete len:531 (-) Transcript_13311:195-1787(-)
MEERDPVVEEVRENLALKRLQERVWRLEADNKELRVGNSILQTQYTSQCETQSDILRTLHANLDENYSKIEELEAKTQTLEQQLEDQKREYEDKIEEEKAKWENIVSGLQQQVEDLKDKLYELREFQKNKDFLEGELASLKKQLNDQSEEHTRDVSAHDRKKAMEIDQLKKDMQRNIKETREMLKAKTKDQLDSTTKRTIMENEQMATELHFQSKETERLIDRNQTLLKENAQLRRNLLIHKDLENELARRTHVYQKLLKKMDQKQKADMLNVERSRDLRLSSSDDTFAEEQNSIMGGASRELSAEMASLSDENETLRRQMEGTQSTLQMVRHEFAQYRRDHATLTQLQDQSTRLIISALYELKNQRECDPFPPATYDEHANWQFVTMTTRQKEYFFRVLLEKLNSSMCSSCFPLGNQSTSQSVTVLPQIGKGSHGQDHVQANHFSQFLWSVAAHGDLTSPNAAIRKGEVAHSGTQTDTASADPCLKDGLWSPQSRLRQSQVTPSMVSGNVRSWGPRVGPQKARSLGRVT